MKSKISVKTIVLLLAVVLVLIAVLKNVFPQKITEKNALPTIALQKTDSQKPRVKLEFGTSLFKKTSSPLPKLEVNSDSCTCCRGKEIPENSPVLLPIYSSDGSISGLTVTNKTLGPGAITTGETKEIGSMKFCKTNFGAWIIHP